MPERYAGTSRGGSIVATRNARTRSVQPVSARRRNVIAIGREYEIGPWIACSHVDRETRNAGRITDTREKKEEEDEVGKEGNDDGAHRRERIADSRTERPREFSSHGRG